MSKQVTTTETKNEVALTGNAALPAYLQGREDQVRMTGLEASDLVIPRIKLLQDVSPEVKAFDNASPGKFWHSVLAEVIGSEFEFTIISFRKKYLLMAPLNDPRGILARAEDGVHWDKPDAEFRVKLKNVKEEQTWKTAPTVRESGLDKFGSSVKGDDDSKPAAVLVYEYLILINGRPDISPIIMSLARSSAKRGKDLNSKVEFRPGDMHAMKFKASIAVEKGDEGEYFNWQFQNDGFAAEDEFLRVKELAAQFGDVEYKVHDEAEAVAEPAADATGESKDY